MKTFNASLLKSLAKAFWGQKYWTLAEMKTPAKPFLYCIDSPQSQNALSAAFVIVNGWIVGNESIAEHNSVLSCPNCGSEFQLRLNHYNFWNRLLTEYGNVKSTPAISANHYDAIILPVNRTAYQWINFR